MCLIALSFPGRADRPLLLAANREEAFARPALPPHRLAGSPAVVGGTDQQAGGTWLGANQFGLIVAVTNRPKRMAGPPARSRGLACRDLLAASTAEEANARAIDFLTRESLAGCNFLCADRRGAWVIHGGDRVESVPLAPGFHLLANLDVNDPSDGRLNRVRGAWRGELAEEVDRFLAWAVEICRLGPGPAGEPPIVLRHGDRGTVSSSLVAIADSPGSSVYRHASGSPDRTPYADYSAVLREVLEGG